MHKLRIETVSLCCWDQSTECAAFVTRVLRSYAGQEWKPAADGVKTLNGLNGCISMQNMRHAQENMQKAIMCTPNQLSINNISDPRYWYGPTIVALRCLSVWSSNSTAAVYGISDLIRTCISGQGQASPSPYLRAYGQIMMKLLYSVVPACSFGKVSDHCASIGTFCLAAAASHDSSPIRITIQAKGSERGSIREARHELRRQLQKSVNCGQFSEEWVEKKPMSVLTVDVPFDRMERVAPLCRCVVYKVLLHR